MRKAAQNHFPCFAETGEFLGDLLNFFGGEEDNIGANPLMVPGQNGSADKEIELAIDPLRPLDEEIFPVVWKDPVLGRDGNACENEESVVGVKTADPNSVPRKGDGVSQLGSREIS